MKVLIFGAAGMLGYSIFKNLSDYSQFDVIGTVRSIEGKEGFFSDCLDQIIKNIDVGDISVVGDLISKNKPDVVINCIGLIKQYSISKQHVDAVRINSLLPHQLASICDKYSCKLIHFSTDCVFDGKKGGYSEQDTPDACDLYGKSKCLGEIDYAPHLTLRTSIIGHELSSSVSLVDWFLSQDARVKGFSKAIFSGLPTCEIAKLLAEKIIPNNKLSGLYHLSVNPIDKYSLLKLVAKIYSKDIEIEESQELIIDRSLNSSILRNKINYKAPSWEKLVVAMHEDYKNRYENNRCKS